MEPPAESRIAARRAFTDFLDRDNGKGDYMAKITRMRDSGKHRLLVDLSDLRVFDSELTRRLIRHPTEHIMAFEEALDDVIRSFDGKYLKEEQEVHVGFEGQLGFNKVTPRELLSPFLGMLVCVEGIITKCSLVRPKVVKSVHFCPATQSFLTREYRDVTSAGLPTGATYPTRDDKGNLLVTEFGLCKYRDHQTLSIQEMPENSPPGQMPRSIDVIVEDDLVDSCKPGDRVSILGVYKAVPTKNLGGVSGTFRTVLVANNVAPLNREADAPRFTAEDLRSIRTIAAREDAFDLLGESLAPSICGHVWIKKAVLLLLLGGMEKNLANGAHLRGDINMMMVGDPSVAKSQMLRAILGTAPLAISTTGRGSSGVGLTAAVTQDQDTGERRLEAGAMVLADRGVVCIDEFDKMSDLDRVAIHEVMEQQTVTVAKAGLHASLNARCSVVAAANPVYGNYDHSLTPTKNIGLPDSLLSRFDLLFIVLDYMDVNIDRHVSGHVLRMHRYRSPMDGDYLPSSVVGLRQRDEPDEGEMEDSVFVKYDRLLHGERRLRQSRRDPLTSKFLKKYIHYARARTPKLTEEASERIAQAYAEMRAAGMGTDRKEVSGTLPITARTLETIIRLSTAHAKLKLRREIVLEDVEAALELLEFAIYHREMKDMEEAVRRRGEEREGGIDPERHGGDEDLPNQGDRQPSKRRRHGAHPAGGRPAGHAEEEEAQGGTGGGGAAAAMDAGGGGVGEVHNRIAQQRPVKGSEENELATAQATLAAIVAEESVHPEVSPERMEAFQSAFVAHVVASRAEALPLTAVLEAVNRSGQQPFSRQEVESIILRMEEENRVMYANGVVHMI